VEAAARVSVAITLCSSAAVAASAAAEIHVDRGRLEWSGQMPDLNCSDPTGCGSDILRR
jgi:hypothetical protein